MRKRNHESVQFPRRQQAVERLIRNKLGNAVRRSGKVFYSSPRSLFAGRYVLMGYNPGGDPTSASECLIRDNLEEWRLTKKNHYWKQRWDGDKFNRLQIQVQQLFDNLGIEPAQLFTSNLWFLRSVEASRIQSNNKIESATVEIWKRFLSCCPARRIICIGVKTANDFLKNIGAEEIRCVRSKTRHPLASAALISANIHGRKYQIAAVPHLSRFGVGNDSHLIRRIKRHFS